MSLFSRTGDNHNFIIISIVQTYRQHTLSCFIIEKMYLRLLDYEIIKGYQCNVHNIVLYLNYLNHKNIRKIDILKNYVSHEIIRIYKYQ